VIKVVSISGPSDLEGLNDAHAAVRFFLFDTKVEGKHGGTGRAFDWKLLKKRPGGRDFFLAGGLNSDNILSACEAGPYCVDLNSGVEVSPGVKDPARVKTVLERMKKYR
jgi:phosphoribosylanthranilate isomerase